MLGCCCLNFKHDKGGMSCTGEVGTGGGAKAPLARSARVPRVRPTARKRVERRNPFDPDGIWEESQRGSVPGAPV